MQLESFYLITFHVRRQILFLDFEPDIQENKYEDFSLHELETLLSSLNEEEESEIQKIKEKFHRQQLLYTRALCLRRPSQSNNSCPNICSRCFCNTFNSCLKCLFKSKTSETTGRHSMSQRRMIKSPFAPMHRRQRSTSLNLKHLQIKDKRNSKNKCFVQ